MAAEGGMLEPISEKIIHGEIENIRFDHILKIKEGEGSPEQAYDDTSIKTEASEPVSLQGLDILRDGQSQPSPAATPDNGIITDEAKDENLHQVTTETVDNTGGQIFNEAPPGVQISLEDNCKDIDADAGFQADSNKEEKEMPESTNINPIASDEDSKDDGPASDEGKEHGTVCADPAKSSHDVNDVKDEGEDNEGRTEQEITEKTTPQTEISEKPTSEIGVKLMEDSQTEHEDVSPGFTDAMKDAGEEPPTKKEETIYKVDLVSIKESDSTIQNGEIISDNQRVTSLDGTETTENDVRDLGENQNFKQDINSAAEEEPKTHELTPASIEERVAEEDKQKESLNAALKEPGVKTQDANEEQEETAEGDTSVQRSATELQNLQLLIEKSPMPSTTETADSIEAQNQKTEEGEASCQRTARELSHLQSTIEESPMYISTPISEQVTHSDTGKSSVAISEERVGEDEKLKGSSNSETGEPCTETQDKPTEEGVTSAQFPVSELQHLPERSPVISKTEDELDRDGARESAPDYTQNQVIEEEKLEEVSNVEGEEPCAQTQESTEEQEETKEGDVSSHISTGENLPIGNHPVDISTSTAEAPLQEDEVKEIAAALVEDRTGDDNEPMETSKVAPEIPATETEDSVEEQKKAIEEGDASLQKLASEEFHLPLQIDKPPVPSTTEDQLARELAPGFTKEHVKEEESLKESYNSETGKPGPQAQNAAEEQHKTTAEGDASTQLSASELHHWPTEKSPLILEPEEQLDVDGAREFAPCHTEDQIKDEKLKEFPNVESAEPGTETQDITEEQEETDEGDVSAHISTGEHLLIKNPAVDFSTSTTEAQLQKDDMTGLAPTLKEDKTGEDDTIETSNVAPEIPATETEDSVAEQEKATEEGNASLQKFAGEEPHLPLQIEKSREPSTSEDQLEICDAREQAPGFTKAYVKEEENLEESSNEETGEPRTETQDATEEQNKIAEEGDHSVQLFVTEPHHLQTEKSPLTSKTEDQLHKDGADYTDSQVREPGTQIQDSTEEQEETEEGDVLAHVSTCQHLIMENHPAGNTSSTEAQLQEDDEKESVPALTEDRMEEDKKLIEDSVEEQEKAIEEGDVSLQKSARIEISPVPPITEDELNIDDAGQLAPGSTKEHVKEEENLKESSDSETGKPGTEARDTTEEQSEETKKGDTSVETSSHELPHLQFSIENPPLGISTSPTEAQLAEDDVKELVPASTENRMGEDQKLTEPSSVTSKEQVAETQGTLEEQEKTTEEGDASARKSASQELHLQLQIKKSPVPSTTEDQSEIENAREFAPVYIKEHVGEEENLKESSNKPGAKTQDSSEEQDKETEERGASAQTCAGELPHLQLSSEDFPVDTSNEAQLTGDDARESVPALTEDQMGERTNIASEEPGDETQNLVEAPEKATEEGDALPHTSDEQHLQLQTEESPAPIATEGQPEIDDARELAHDINKEQVREEEKLTEPSHAASGETATQTQGSTEEQDKNTEEGDASVHMSSGEQWSNENPPVHASSWTNEVQLPGVDARELVAALSEDRMGNNEKSSESSNAASKEPSNEIQDSVKEHEKASEEGDVSDQMPPSEELHLQLQIEYSTIPSTTEDQMETDEVEELAPRQKATEHEKLKESPNVVSGGPGTETQESTEEQHKETEEGNASVHMSAGELSHPSTENPSVHISASTTEVQVMGDNARELGPAFTDGVGENENLTKSSNEQSGEQGIETQDATEEQDKTTKEGDPSVHLSVTELHYLQREKSPSLSKTENQLGIDGSRESAPDYAQDQVIKEEKLEEYSNVDSVEPGAQTQDSTDDSTEEQEETQEGDVPAHVSSCEHLSMENSPAGMSTSTTEAQLQEDVVRELAPALTENRMEEEKKLIETSNVAPEIPATETEDLVEEQEKEKAIEEEDDSFQRSTSEELHFPLQIEKSPVPSTTEDQLEIDDARQLAPGFTKEHVKEEENLKECSISTTGEPGTETQDAIEVQDKETEEGDASNETSASNLSHLQYSFENPPLGISTITTDAQLKEDDVKEPVPALTENIMGENEMLMKSSVVASKQSVVETHGSVEEQEEKARAEGDASTQKSNSELSHMQLPTENSAKHTTEVPFETDDTRELAPALIEEIVLEQESLIKSSNVAPGETGTETQGSTEEQEKANEEEFTSVQKSASELHNLQWSDVSSPENIHTSSIEDKSETDEQGDHIPTLNPKDEDSLATSTSTITQETIPDQEILQQTHETENALMTNTQEVSEVKHAEVKAGTETPSDVIAIEHADDLPKEFSEREILGADNEEASDPHPREGEPVAETGKNLLNPVPEMIEATRTEMESMGNEPFIKNVEEISHDTETITENIKDVTSESMTEHQQTDYATYGKQDVLKTMSDEQQTTESNNNLVEEKKDATDIEKDKIISESIDDNHSQDVTSELGGNIENLTNDNKVEQMIPPLANPNKCIDTAIAMAEDNSNNKISSNIDNIKDTETIHDAVDGMQEKVSSSISEEGAHDLTNINENLGTGMKTSDDSGTISDSFPEKQNRESIFSASNIKTESMPDVDTVDNKVSEKMDLHEHAENAEINCEADFSKNLADTSDIHISILKPMVDNVSEHNEEPSEKYKEEKSENTSTDLARDADVQEDEVECIEKHEIMSELIHEEQNQETTGEPEILEVEKRAYDEKADPVSSSENLIETSVQKDETFILNVEETEKAHIMSEEISQKQEQKTREIETAEVEKRACDEISESLSNSEHLIADNMQKNESPMLDVEEHDNESSEVNDILENKLSDDGKTTKGAISGPSSEEKIVSSVFEEEGTKKLGICLNQTEVGIETISLDDNKDEMIPKDEETLYQTSDSSTVSENIDTPIDAESRKFTINEEGGSDASDIVNVEPKIVDEGCEDNAEQKFEEAATKSDGKVQYSEISEKADTTQDADSHEQIKDSNIPTDGYDVERKADAETEKISSAETETETEPALEEDKIVITPQGDIEDTTIDAKKETEKKLDTFQPSSIMVDQEDFQSQKGDQMGSDKESNVSMRDMISNPEGKYYLASQEQSLETIAEIDITKTKAAEDESNELEEISGNVADGSPAEEIKQEGEKQDMPPDVSDKTQVPESTDRDVGMDLDLLKANSESLGQLKNLATLESEEQSDKHITEIEIIKSVPAAQDSTKDKIGERYNLLEKNNKGHDMSEAEVAPLEEAETVKEAELAVTMQPQDIFHDKINEDNVLESEENMENAETDKSQENAMAKDEVCLRIENDNQESTPVSVSDAAETTKEEDAETVITKEIDNTDATHKESPGSKIDDLCINHDLEEETLKEASSPRPEVDNMESVTIEESEETCESSTKECQEVLDENESLEDVSIKNAKEHMQLEEQEDKLSERLEAANSIGEIEKEMIKKGDSSEVHDIAFQKDEIAIELMETGTETQATLESEVKESDTISVSSTSNKNIENDLAISSSKEDSAVETVLLEPEFATEKTDGAKGSTESADVSEIIIVNDSIDGNNMTDEDISNGGLPDIPEAAKASAEDTTDTEIKEKVAEQEAIAEPESISVNDTEDKNLPVSSSFTEATHLALARDANEDVEDIAKASHGVEESDNSQHKESLESDPADLPVSRFLMDHILHQGDASDEVGNVESENNIEEETSSDKLMNISIQEQEIFRDPLSAELVFSENIIESKDLEKLEDTILQQDNTPADTCDVEADNEIKQEHTSNEQKGTNIQENGAIMDSVSAQQIDEEKSTPEDRDQEKPGDQVLQEGIAPDDVCDVKAEHIITEENNNDKNESISIQEQKVTMGPLSAKEMPKDGDIYRAEVASGAVNEEQKHETKEDDEKPIAKDAESPQSNICLSSTTTACELVEVEVPGSSKGESASMDDYRGVTPTDEGDLGSEEEAEKFTSPTSVQDEKITASPTATKITENSSQKDNYLPVTNASNVSIPRDGENTRTFDNVERMEKDAHSISEEQITSAISELLVSTTTVVKSEEPQTYTKCEETKLETTENIKASGVEVTENQVRNLNNDSVEEPEESALEKVQLSDLLLLSRNQNTQKTTPAVTKDREQAEEAEHTKMKEGKTDEEKDEKVGVIGEDEQEEHKTDNNAAVIVEAREAELKPAHKKSHNILSGVGSKVKHSIAKVKKAITGKSSHQKTISPKKATA